jgi:hypothetical protein
VAECRTLTIFLDKLLKNRYNRDMAIKYRDHTFSSYLDLVYHLDTIQGNGVNYSDFIPEDSFLYIYYNLKEKFPLQEWPIEKVKELLAEELALHHIKVNATEDERMQFCVKNNIEYQENVSW